MCSLTLLSKSDIESHISKTYRHLRNTQHEIFTMNSFSIQNESRVPISSWATFSQYFKKNLSKIHGGNKPALGVEKGQLLKSSQIKRISEWLSIICSSSLSQIIVINLFHTYVLLHNHDAVSMYLRLLMSWIVYHLGYSPGPHPQRWRQKRQAKACSAARVSNSLKEGSSEIITWKTNSYVQQTENVWKAAYHHESFGKPPLCIPLASACCPRVGLLQGHHSGKQEMWYSQLNTLEKTELWNYTFTSTYSNHSERSS